MKFYIWGLGEVGYSFLKKVKDEGLFDPSVFYCVEPNVDRKRLFINLGGLDSNFINDKITKDNYEKYISLLNKGDYILDFAIDIKNLTILEKCLTLGIHYLFTADASWNPDPDWLSVHQHYIEYLKLKSKFTGSEATSIVAFGMNPGLVSLFAKQGIKDIVNLDNSPYVRRNRKRLNKLLNEGKYNLVAKKLKVTYIQEIDNDDQEVSINYDGDTLYSTWNPWAFFYETISSPEVALGTKKEYLAYGKIFDCDAKDLFVGLYKSGYEYPETTYSPQGSITGHISTHEEIFTIRKFFTYHNYKPSVYFVYSPCNYAIASIKDCKKRQLSRSHLITKDEIVSGGESVGVIIRGKRFKTRYFGNYLKTTDIEETATILQVSAGAFSSFKYMLNHPNEGMLFPEELDEEEVLATAKKYLKEYISTEYPKILMNLGRNQD